MTTVLRMGSMLDGTGNSPVELPSIVVQDGIITALNQPHDMSKECVVMDFGPSATAIPGIVNLHAHICQQGGPEPWPNPPLPAPLASMIAARSLAQELHSGVTTLRDAGSPHQINIHARTAIQEGHIVGPQLFSCGAPISATGGHCWEISREADGVSEIAKAVREQMKLGADFIKVMLTGGVITRTDTLGAEQLSLEELSAAVSVAHRNGKRVAAHCINRSGVLTALRAGVDSVEHGVDFSEMEVELMVKQGTFLVPTFSPMWIQSTHGKELGMPDWVINKASRAMESHFRSTRRAFDAGVLIGLGTDAGGLGVRHDLIGLEIRLMAEAGCCKNIPDLIRICTSQSARALGLEKVGTLGVGMVADMVILNGNPMTDISCLDDVLMVIKSGKVAFRSSKCREVAEVGHRL